MTTLLFDIETNGLIPELDTIHSLVIKDADTKQVWSCHGDIGKSRGEYDEQGKLTLYPTVPYGLGLLQDADTIVGHNIIKFDVPAIQKLYPTFKPKRVRDTLVMARLFIPDIGKGIDDVLIAKKLLPGNMRGRYSLEAFGHRMGKWKGDYSKVMKEAGLDPWAQWSELMQKYCEQDIEVTAALWDKLNTKYGVGYSERSIELEHRVQEIIHRQEENGIAFDGIKAATLYAHLAGRRAEMEEELRQTFKPWFISQGEVTQASTKRVKQTTWAPIGEKTIKGKDGVRVEPIYPVALHEAGTASTKVKLREFNPQSRDHITNRLEALFGWRSDVFTDGGKAKVDDAILSKLPWPEAQQLAKYLMVCKRIGTLAEGPGALMKVEKRGRIHGQVIPCGAVTRRMTHSKPNYNLPKVKSDDAAGGVLRMAAGGYGWEFRELFTVVPSRVLVGCDADALELRCLAGYMAPYDGGAYIETVLRGDKALGTDMHSVNARALGIDPKKSYTVKGRVVTGRDLAKTWFYAFIYGSGDANLGALLGRDLAAGRKSRADFLQNLPALGKLVDGILKKIADKFENSRTGKTFYRLKPGATLKGLDGGLLQVRHVHAALNTLLQSAGAIIMKAALVILDDDLHAAGLSHLRDGVGDYEFCANVHDEWQIEARPEVAQQVATAAEEAIRKAGESLNFNCPLAGNAAIGRNWASTH